MDYAKMKKDFQKVVSGIRKAVGDEFPKAMMTGQQMAKNTATVNCGGEWKGGVYSRNLADKVLADPSFCAYLERYGATAHLEKTPSGGIQVRIWFK